VGAAAAWTRAARPAALATVSEWAVDEVAASGSTTADRPPGPAGGHGDDPPPF
jgi:hypothetical protein